MASARWLESVGGGTIVSDLKSSLEDGFDTSTGAEFARVESALSSMGVRLSWRRRGVPRGGNVVAAFPTRDLIEELDGRDGIANLLVIGWSERDWEDWAERRCPTRLTIE